MRFFTFIGSAGLKIRTKKMNVISSKELHTATTFSRCRRFDALPEKCSTGNLYLCSRLCKLAHCQTQPEACGRPGKTRPAAQSEKKNSTAS
jgi:hypothetical protein